MTISFNLIPTNLRTPGAYVEIDNSRALRGLAQFNQRILVIGPRTSSGTVAAEVLTLVSSEAQAKSFFGKGSILANMFSALKANNRYIETYAIALDDDASGVAATGSIEVTAAPTANGTLSLYVAGKRLQIAITSTMTDANVATAIVAAITADGDLPVSAAVNGSDTALVDLTAKNDGTTGNEIDLRVNFLGEASGEDHACNQLVIICHGKLLLPHRNGDELHAMIIVWLCHQV